VRVNLDETFQEISTAQLADACVRLGVPLRMGSATIRPVIEGMRVAGAALPVQHFGSVDVFFEAFARASHGDVLVIDNQARTDEACIGDLTVLEARAAGLAGIVVRGLHRDTEELLEIALPVFSHGTCSAGPRRVDPRDPLALEVAHFGDFDVTKDDAVFADADGVLFASLDRVEEIVVAARAIRRTERAQAEGIAAGRTLREQLRFDEYLAHRRAHPEHTFRQHLRKIGGAIEE